VNFNICIRVDKYLEGKYFEGFRERRIGVSTIGDFLTKLKK